MKKITILLLALFSIFQAKATHVVGGEIAVTQTAANVFTIKVRVFRDCNPGNAPMPTSVNLGIYQKGTNSLLQSFNIPRITLQQVPLGDSCYTPTTLCIQEGVFVQSNVNIPNFVNGYYLQTELFARNGIITNIQNPGGTGMSFYAEIPDPAIANFNSTPDFGNYPSDGYFCIGFEKKLNFGLVDPDGDLLVYSLVDPLNSVGTSNLTNPGPYPPVVWQNPFSLSNICGGNPPMSINPTTGVITANPSNAGVYVFAVRVEEFRNGVKIGEVRRDVQYAALNCVQDQPPVFVNLPSQVTVYVNHEACFDILAKDADGNDTIYLSVTSNQINLNNTYIPPVQSGNSYYYLDFQGQDTLWFSHLDIVGGNYEGIGMIPMRFCFTPRCEDRDSTYYIDFMTFSLGCAGSDTTEATVEVKVINSTPILDINLPDNGTVVFDNTICFELQAVDPINPNSYIYIETIPGDFEYPKSYEPPVDTTRNGQNWSYYTNYLGQDTLWMRNYTVSGSRIYAYEAVAARYCFYADCQSVYDEKYTPHFKTYSAACGSDTVSKSFVINIIGKDGYANEVPNVFTPNGDGKNDYFMLSGEPDICYDSLNVKIYNRWGLMVYESNDPYFKWDGKNKSGKDCTAGTYLILVEGFYGSRYHGGGKSTREPIAVKKQYHLQLLR